MGNETLAQANPSVGGKLMTQRLRRRPAQSWTPMMPKMKKTKKQRRRTLPNIGNVSRRRFTGNLWREINEKIQFGTGHNVSILFIIIFIKD